jgi:hypothetical protein
MPAFAGLANKPAIKVANKNFFIALVLLIGINTN